MLGCSSKKVNARIVNNALVVSFLGMEPPKVWRADLAQVSNATLEIRAGQGKHTLIVKNGTGSAEDIVSFPDKDSARDALLVITGALLEVEGAVSNKPGFFANLFRWIGRLLIVIVVLMILLIMFGPSPKKTAENSAVKTGAPVPAEQLLGQ